MSSHIQLRKLAKHNCVPRGGKALARGAAGHWGEDSTGPARARRQSVRENQLGTAAQAPSSVGNGLPTPYWMPQAPS